MARKKIVAGNWKMNKTLEEGVALAKEIMANTPPRWRHQVVLATPFIHLKAVKDVIKKRKYFHLAAQNCHQEEKGAYTGEVSTDMLLSVGASHVIIGHSERRQYFGETDDLLLKKTLMALKKGLTPIFCIGEPLEIRQDGSHIRYVLEQLMHSVFHLPEEDFEKIVLAYEPIWAIGTGMTASPEQAQEMHAQIRKMIGKHFNKKLANNTTILYGGSCNAKNAAVLFCQKDVDGGLIGGASLQADDFVAIMNSL